MKFSIEPFPIKQIEEKGKLEFEKNLKLLRSNQIDAKLVKILKTRKVIQENDL